MPIYEYRCAACGHELEALQRFVDAPLVKCPACGKETLNKLVSAAGFQLKGSGWYATDFKNSGSKPPAKDKSEASGGSSDKGGDGKAAGGDGGAAKSETASTKSESTSGSSEGAASKKESASSASSTPA